MSASLDYHYRDITKPPIQLDESKSIISLGLPRTGSTVVFNVLRYLFEEEIHEHFGLGKRVLKAHGINDILGKYPLNENVIICHSVRDPLGMVASRTASGHGRSLGRFINPLRFIPRRTPYNLKILTFRYEKFDNNSFDHIYDVIEEGFGVTIPEKSKQEIQKHFSIEAGKTIQAQYTSFKDYDKISGIHGKHINHSSWQQLLTLEQAKYVYEKNYYLRQQWGYGDLDIEGEWYKANPEAALK